MWIDKFVWSKLWPTERGQTHRHTPHGQTKSKKWWSCQMVPFTLRLLWPLTVQYWLYICINWKGTDHTRAVKTIQFRIGKWISNFSHRNWYGYLYILKRIKSYNIEIRKQIAFKWINKSILQVTNKWYCIVPVYLEGSLPPIYS